MTPISCDPTNACCPREVSVSGCSPAQTKPAAQGDTRPLPHDAYHNTVDVFSLLKGGKLIGKSLSGLVLGASGCATSTIEGKPPVDSGQTPDGAIQKSLPVPEPSTLAKGQTFPRTRVFSGWPAVNNFEELSTVFYRSCYANDSDGENFYNFSDEGKCPNDKFDISRFRVIEPLYGDPHGDQKYRFKVRACYVDQQGNQQNARCGKYSQFLEFGTDRSLVGWWKFDDRVMIDNPISNKPEDLVWQATDTSGNQLHGWMDGSANPEAGTGLIGGALAVDGIGDYVKRDADELINNLFDKGGTVEAWIRPGNAGQAGAGRIIAKHNDALIDGGWLLRLADYDNGKMGVRFQKNFTGGEGQWDTLNRPVTANQWNHAVVTYTNSSIDNDPIIYINGNRPALQEISAPTGALGASDDSLALLMANSETRDHGFDGRLDEVAIYNRALS